MTVRKSASRVEQRLAKFWREEYRKYRTLRRRLMWLNGPNGISVQKVERVLTASRRAANAMLCSAQGSVGAGIMDAITLVVFIGSIYPAGRIAERRGRSFKTWAWIAAFIGPLAFPLLFLFPNLHRENGAPA